MTDATALARWLDPEVRAFIARTNSFYPDSANTGDIAAARALYDRLCAGFRTPHPPGVTIAADAAPAEWGAVQLRRYHPPQRRRDAVLLYLHGGGYVLGGLDSHDDVCADLCAGTGMEVVAADYRLAPEHRYPAALDDSMAAYRLLARDRPVLVAGDSAGGNIAAALCRRLHRLGEAQPRAQILIYPGLDPDPLRGGSSRAATAPLLTAADCDFYRRLYAGGRARVPQRDAEFAPLAAEDFAGLAPAAIFAAGYDPLHQDGEDYAAVLNAAGVPVIYRSDPGLVHGWLRGRHDMRLARLAFAKLVDDIAALADET